MSAAERNRTNDDLCTPLVIPAALAPLGVIALDPCSNPWSELGARVTLDGSSPEEDGLAADWLEIAGTGLIFVNPPYGRGHPRRWARKIALEAGRGCQIVALVKGDHSTKWWEILRRPARAIAFWRGRLGFLGGKHSGGKFASSLVYYGDRPHLFADALEAYADVWVIR